MQTNDCRGMHLALLPTNMDANHQRPEGLYRARKRKLRERNRKVNEAMKQKLSRALGARSFKTPEMIHAKETPMWNKGFTLIELMIVVAILSILTAAAIPNYLRFQSLCKRSEAHSIFHGASLAETAYFSSFDVYTLNPYTLIQNGGAKQFKYYKPDFLQIKSGNQASGYGLLLTGNIDADSTSDILFMIVGDPRPWEYSLYKEGIYVVLNDLIL